MMFHNDTSRDHLQTTDVGFAMVQNVYKMGQVELLEFEINIRIGKSTDEINCFNMFDCK